MKKNKELKKQILLYKKEIILNLKRFMENEISIEELSCLIGDLSLTNELISVSKKIDNMNFAIINAFNISLSEFVPFDIENDYVGAHYYYESLLNEIIKNKFNNKVLKKSAI